MHINAKDGWMKREPSFVFKIFEIEDKLLYKISVLNLFKLHLSSDTKTRLATNITDWRIDVCFEIARRKFK